MNKNLILMLMLGMTLMAYSQPPLNESVKRHFSTEQINKYHEFYSAYNKDLADKALGFRWYILFIYQNTLLRESKSNPLLNLILADAYSTQLKNASDEEEITMIYNDWGCVLFKISKYMNDYRPYGKKAESLFKKAEQRSDQLGAYNLACFYSVKMKKKKSIEWLNKMMSKNYKIKDSRINKENIENEIDFEYIKNTPEFAIFLNNVFSNKIEE